jgi:chromosome segregation ATPase
VNSKNEETKEGLINIKEKVEMVENVIENMITYLNGLNSEIENINVQINQIWQNQNEMKNICRQSNEGIDETNQN